MVDTGKADPSTARFRLHLARVLHAKTHHLITAANADNSLCCLDADEWFDDAAVIILPEQELPLDLLALRDSGIVEDHSSGIRQQKTLSAFAAVIK